MNHALLVRVLESLCHLDQHRYDLEIACTTQSPQITARSELHRQEESLFIPLGCVDLDDVGMMEAAGTGMLVQQRLPGGFTTAGRRPQDLQRDIDAEPGIVRAPHLALAASAKAIMQCVAGGGMPRWYCGGSFHHELLSARDPSELPTCDASLR